MGLKNPEKYANFYIKGKFKSLKNSVNNGNIEDGSGEGSVVFAIDSIAKCLAGLRHPLLYFDTGFIYSDSASERLQDVI